MNRNNIVALDEVTYFPYDEHRWEYSWDIYVKYPFSDNAFEYNVSEQEMTSIQRQIEDVSSVFVVFAVDSGSSVAINKAAASWIIMQPEAVDDYPGELLSPDGELLLQQSSSSLADLSQQHVLWFLPTVTEAENQTVFDDFSSLLQLGTRLNQRFSRAIDVTRQSRQSDYDGYLADKSGSGYRDNFFRNWGYHVSDRDGQTSFYPGYAAGRLLIEKVFRPQTEPTNTLMPVQVTENSLRYRQLAEMVVLECPTVFLGIDSFQNSHEPSADQFSDPEQLRTRSRTPF